MYADTKIFFRGSDTARKIYKHLNGAIRDVKVPKITSTAMGDWSETEIAGMPPTGNNALTKPGSLLTKRNGSMGIDQCVLAEFPPSARSTGEKCSGTIADSSLATIDWDSTASIAAITHVEQTAVAIINQMFELFSPEDRDAVANHMKPLLESFNTYIQSSSFHAIRTQANIRLLRRDLHLKEYKPTAAAKLRVMPIDDNRVVIGTKTVSETATEPEATLKLRTNYKTSSSNRQHNSRNNRQYVRRGYNNSRQQTYRPNFRRNTDNRPYRQQKQHHGASSSKKH